MNEDMTNGFTIYHLLQHWWQSLPPQRRRRWWIGFLLLFIIWLIGGYLAYSEVAGIRRLSGLTRPLMAFSMGGFGLLWAICKRFDLIQETTQQPHLLWIPLGFALPFAIYGLSALLGREVNPAYRLRWRKQQFAQSQGRQSPEKMIQHEPFKWGIPFALIQNKRREDRVVGLDQERDAGHALVIGRTRAGKGLHLSQTLLSWNGPVLVIDPKAEQFERTATTRHRLGPIFRLPGHELPLANYYERLLDRDAVAELHQHWMQPWASKEQIFAQKARTLFTAAGLYAKARSLDPIRLLLDLAESDPTEALAALELEPSVRRHIRLFTNGAAPNEYQDDKFVTSAFGNFTTRLAPFQKHIDTIAPTDRKRLLDPRWAQQNGTIYITYSLHELAGAGSVVASIIAAILRTHRWQRGQPRLLVAIDELPALGLKNISDYLATVGGAGITLLLYAQSIPQLRQLYGIEGCRAILSNCDHNVWYPPADYETAELMSKLYGMTLRASPSHSASRGARQWQGVQGGKSTLSNLNESNSWQWQERPELLPSQMMALPNDSVLVTTLRERRYAFLAKRLNPIPIFDKLPSPRGLRLPRPQQRERLYSDWNVATKPADEATTSDDDSGDVTEAAF